MHPKGILNGRVNTNVTLSIGITPFVRRIRSLEVALLWLYMKSVSTKERVEATKIMLGLYAQGLLTITVYVSRMNGRINSTFLGVCSRQRSLGLYLSKLFILGFSF